MKLINWSRLHFHWSRGKILVPIFLDHVFFSIGVLIALLLYHPNLSCKKFMQRSKPNYASKTLLLLQEKYQQQDLQGKQKNFTTQALPKKSSKLRKEISNKELTLWGPKFLTEQANLTSRPAGTVIFSIDSANSGSVPSDVVSPPAYQTNIEKSQIYFTNSFLPSSWLYFLLSLVVYQLLVPVTGQNVSQYYRKNALFSLTVLLVGWYKKARE